MLMGVGDKDGNEEIGTVDVRTKNDSDCFFCYERKRGNVGVYISSFIS